jgi:hypothetical protein
MDMKTFDDLKFETEFIIKFGSKIRATLKLNNGVVVSVIGGVGCYGDGMKTFEIAAWRDGDSNFLRLGESDDVLGFLTKDEITDKMVELSKI